MVFNTVNAKRASVALRLLLCLIALIASFTPVRAQNGADNADLVVLQPALVGPPDQTQIKVAFTLRDQHGRPALPQGQGPANEAQITFQGQAIPATVGPMEDPLKIVLLLDISRSMTIKNQQGTPLIAQVQAAAQRMVEVAPPNAEIAIFGFAERVVPLYEGFLRRSGDQAELINDAIRDLKVISSEQSDTCVYDAASQALDALMATTPTPTESLAVVVFTDGKDREAGGALCPSEIGQDALVRKANAIGPNPIPIYPIMVCANSAEAATPCAHNGLAELAEQTGAFAESGNRDQLEQLFTSIMQTLSSQWVAQAPICPGAGSNIAVLEVTFGEARFSEEVAFDVVQPCNLPPTFDISQQRYLVASDSYSVTLTIGNPQGVSQVSVGIYRSEQGGTPVGTPIMFDVLSSSLEFELPADGMELNKEYYLLVKATDRYSNTIRTAEGSTIVASDPLNYNPTLGFSIGAIYVKDDQLRIAVKIKGAGGRIVALEGEIHNQETGQIEPLAATLPQDEELRLPLPGMLREASGEQKYLITLSTTVGGNPVRRETERTLTGLGDQGTDQWPLWLLVVLLAFVAVAASYQLVRIRQQRAAGTIYSPHRNATQVVPSAGARSSTITQPAVAGRSFWPWTAPRRLRLKVVRTPAPGLPIEHQITHFPFVIGREQAHLKLPHDLQVSGRHLKITRWVGRFYLTDLKSSNGTWVGKRRLAEGEKVAIREAVVVRLGPATIIELEPVSEA
jgi:hypothetical protein